PRRIQMREDADHAGCGFRRCDVDLGDPCMRTRRADDHRVDHVLHLDIGRITRTARDLLLAVQAIDCSADTHAAPPATCSVRIAVRFASSILKPFCLPGRAAAKSVSSARRIAVSSSSAAPTSAASPLVKRHGFGATPPSAILAARMILPSVSTLAAAEINANSYD